MTQMLEPKPLPANSPATDKLAGRVAFITGGTLGIGAAIAHSLANQGATVAVGYNRDQASAERFVSELSKKLGRMALRRPRIAGTSARAGTADAQLPRSSRPTGGSTFWSTMPESRWTRPLPR
jgi:NAD(P)-dependent dehydrogenase (short-subunit alcohol dehydrogenase family)